MIDEQDTQPINTDPTPLPGFTEGRIVHYVLPNGEHRPAIIVRAWPSGTGGLGYANLQVFTDGLNDINAFESNDDPYHGPDANADEVRSGIVWVMSRNYSEEKTPRTWHWIEKA